MVSIEVRKVKGIKVDARTGKTEIVEDEMPITPKPPSKEVRINLEELVQLLEWAKKQGIIRKG